MPQKPVKPTVEFETSKVLKESISGLVEGLTGIASSDRKDLFLSIGYIFQRMRGGNFLQTLLDEWNEFRSKGKIQDDYMQSEQHRACLTEILDFLDRDLPDETRFSLLKGIFLEAATEEKSDRSGVLPQQFMKIARELSTGEVLVLASSYEGYKTKPELLQRDLQVNTWRDYVARESGLTHTDLVEIHEQTLIEKNY